MKSLFTAWRGPAWFALALALALVLAGCAGGDPLESKAKKTFVEVVAQQPDHAIYAAELGERATSPFVVDQIRVLAGSGHYKTALAAVKVFADHPELEAGDTLAQVFEQKKGALQLTAAIALAKRGDAAAADWLAGKVESTSGAPHVELIQTLAKLGRKDEVLPAIRTKIDNKSQAIRDLGYSILAGIDEPWSREMLLKGLDKEFGEDRRTAIAALGRVGDAETAKKLARFSNTQGLVFVTAEALGDLGNPDVAPRLEAILNKDEESAQVFAAVALHKLGKLAEPADVLGRLAAVEDPRVRETLAVQLERVDDAVAQQVLAGLAQDADESVRAAALRGLISRDDPGLKDVYLARMEDSSYTVRTIALLGLARLGDAATVETIAPMLDDSIPYVRLSAAHAILEIKSRGQTA